MTKLIDVTHSGKLWNVTLHDGDNTKLIVSCTRRDDARLAGIAAARALECEFQIRDSKGQFGEKNSYGHDPRDIPG